MRRIIFFLLIAINATAYAQDAYLFVGTYTSGKSKGIYVYKFNTASGVATEVSTLKADNPSYLAIAPDGKHIYSANEGPGMGSVGAYAFDAQTGQLRLLNNQSAQGKGTCYIAEDKSMKWVTVANYSSGSLTALPVNSDGSLAPAAQNIQHEGSGPVKDRQERSHVHSTIFSPDEKFLYVADLGTDKEHIYRFDANQPKPLSEAVDSFISLTPATGPRHIVFHPTKPFVYLIGELSGTIDAFHYDQQSGKLTPVQRLNTTPDDFTGHPDGADIHIGPDGKFLYATDRGNANSIAVFAIGEDGRLTKKQYLSVNGNHPRNFVIDPTGRFLLVANKDTDNVVIFSIDPATGLLTATGKELQIPSPVCLKFLVP
ncbi:MAG TPA: lactonase family protein [Puia sp.]|nr:lactonase family protein [Puia sp.]